MNYYVFLIFLVIINAIVVLKGLPDDNRLLLNIIMSIFR